MNLRLNHSIRLFQLLLLSTAFACGSKNQSEERTNGYSNDLKTTEDSLFHQVMEDHNIAMAKMGKLNRYLKAVQLHKDSTEKLSPRAQKLATSYRERLDSIDVRLRHAENVMNVWMEQFNVDSASEANKNRKQYLESERVKVNIVKNTILQTLDSADSLFAKTAPVVTKN